jgi:hypothetical protein
VTAAILENTTSSGMVHLENLFNTMHPHPNKYSKVGRGSRGRHKFTTISANPSTKRLEVRSQDLEDALRATGTVNCVEFLEEDESDDSDWMPESENETESSNSEESYDSDCPEVNNNDFSDNDTNIEVAM